LIKGADQIFSGRQIDPNLASHGTIHLCEQGGRNLDEVETAQVRGGDKPSEISNHTPTQGHDEGFAFKPMGGQLIVTGSDDLQGLGGFPGGYLDDDRFKSCAHQRFNDRVGIERGHGGIRQDAASAGKALFGAEAPELGKQAIADMDGIRSIRERNAYSAHGCHTRRFPEPREERGSGSGPIKPHRSFCNGSALEFELVLNNSVSCIADEDFQP
jgi:hypothetical protein